MDQQPIVVELELLQADGCLSGRITGPDGNAADFSGWIGLTAGLDALLRSAEDTDSSRGDADNLTPEGESQ